MLFFPLLRSFDKLPRHAVLLQALLEFRQVDLGLGRVLRQRLARFQLEILIGDLIVTVDATAVPTPALMR